MTTAYAQHSHESGSIGSVRVAEAMHAGVVTCHADASLSTVARTMAAHRIHAVVVVPKRGTDEWAVLSDLALIGAVGKGLCGVATAGKVASTQSLVVRTDDTVARAARLMHEYGTNHLVVLGRRSRRPVGIVSTLDIADVIAELPQQASDMATAS
jgi:CBS domain-containing protein